MPWKIETEKELERKTRDIETKRQTERMTDPKRQINKKVKMIRQKEYTHTHIYLCIYIKK